MKYFYSFLLLFLLILMLFGLGLYFGETTIPFWQTLSTTDYRILIDIRLLRLCLAFLAGGILAIGGVVFQTVLMNPLAEPYILGVLSGASLGSVLALYLGSVPVVLASFLGALVSIGLVYVLSGGKGFNGMRMILAGVMVNAFFSALLMFLMTLKEIRGYNVLLWLMGDLSRGTWGDGLLLVMILVLGLLGILIFHHALDACVLGDEEAGYLGISPAQVKLFLFIIVSLMVGALVAVTGMIGFVGLVVPHFFKRWVGLSHAKLLLFSLFGGGALVMMADILSRTLFYQVQIGVLMALIGVPLFIFVLRKL